MDQRKLLAAWMMGALAAAPALALAQDEPAPARLPGGLDRMGLERQEAEEEQRAPVSGELMETRPLMSLTLKGEVHAIDVERGLLELDTERGMLSFRAPEAALGELAGLDPGQLVSVTYQELNNALWISQVTAPPAPRAPAAPRQARTRRAPALDERAAPGFTEPDLSMEEGAGNASIP